MGQETMTVREAAAYLKLKTATLYKLTRTEQIPFCKPTGKILFRKKDLDEWLEASRKGPAQELAKGGQQL